MITSSQFVEVALDCHPLKLGEAVFTLLATALKEHPVVLVGPLKESNEYFRLVVDDVASRKKFYQAAERAE